MISQILLLLKVTKNEPKVCKLTVCIPGMLMDAVEKFTSIQKQNPCQTSSTQLHCVQCQFITSFHEL